MKKRIILISFIIFVSIPFKTFAAMDYNITSYHIDLIVNENNTFYVTEKIEVDFRKPKHGIVRVIPLNYQISRADGTSEEIHSEVSNIKIAGHTEEGFATHGIVLKRGGSTSFVSYNFEGNKVIELGDNGTTFTGNKIYEISYTYNIGKDKEANFDELYFNLLGTEWDTGISNFSFKITMPKEFDETKLGFTTGEYGSTNSEGIHYSIEGNIISGYYQDGQALTLNPGEGVTVRLELPEGYFVGATDVKNIGIWEILAITIPIIFVIISFLIWRKYGKDDIVIESVEFYPPGNYNSAEIGFLYKGGVNNTDVNSLLIYLANKGYIKIEEIENTKTIFNTPSASDNFKIIKLKDYDGNKFSEKMYLDGLFKNKQNIKQTLQNGKQIYVNEQISVGGEVTKKDLYNKFYKTLSKISKEFNKKENKEKIFEKTSLNKSYFIILMTVITVIVIAKPIVESTLVGTITIIYFFISLFIFELILGAFIISYKNTKNFMSGDNKKTIELVRLFTIFSLFVFYCYNFSQKINDSSCAMIFIIGLACIMIMSLFIKIMSKRNEYGNKIYGKILGFKKFLETAEKDKLEALVMETPEYFYNILPYTYVLGVSDKWIKKFESIALQSPNRYSGKKAFSIATFGKSIGTTMASAGYSSSGSGGGGGGGGRSGGGHGGGGGRSR